MSKSLMTTSARRRRRDKAVTLAINAAGSTVIVLILLILAYLIVVALPLAGDASVEALEVQSVDPQSSVVVATRDGRLWTLPEPPEFAAVGEDRVTLSQGNYAVKLIGERLHFYVLDTSSGTNAAAQNASLPMAQWLRSLAAPGIRSESLSIDARGTDLLLAYQSESGTLSAWSLVDEPGTALGQLSQWTAESAGVGPTTLLVDASRARVLAFEAKRFVRWELPLNFLDAPESLSGGTLAGLTSAVKSLAWGPDRETLLVVDASDELHRFDSARPWLPRLGAPLRLPLVIDTLVSESRRRVSYIIGAEGELLILNPSSGEQLFRGAPKGLAGPGLYGVSDDGAYLFRLESRQFLRWPLDNPYPETGWRSLWKPQWYSAYDTPGYSWQPEGASIGVLSKYGITPLLFGTFKAAMYGMAMAIPLALGAAVYTGYFLAPRRRNQIKPAIEMLEAFPTVVLGFLAGLWVAPLLGEHLFLVLVLPVILVAAPVLLAFLQLALLYLVPAGARRPPRLLLVFIVYTIAILVLTTYADSLEAWLLGGSMRDWIWQYFGLRYDQRNALLVGLAMGIAITPVMFSIVEDAIFAVPRSLSDGSLALGATRWQSLARVVLPSASPAILSALLIGVARGLGETMIVLLATGNTPLMQGDLFSGLRSISASIAMELPEAGAGGVHFRLLFFAALVLFALTFVLNTIAELFRLRLRYIYARA